MISVAERALKSLRATLSHGDAGRAKVQDGPTLSLKLQEMLAETIYLLESKLPANPASPENERAARRVEREMRAYFKALEGAIPLEQLEMIYYSHVETE